MNSRKDQKEPKSNQWVTTGSSYLIRAQIGDRIPQRRQYYFRSTFITLSVKGKLVKLLPVGLFSTKLPGLVSKFIVVQQVKKLKRSQKQIRRFHQRYFLMRSIPGRH